MKEDKFQNLYKRSSARDKYHDYNNGQYFITVCTAQRKHFFGEIIPDKSEHQMKMCLSELGCYAQEQLNDISAHYPFADIPLSVVMPDHIHAMIRIEGDFNDNTTDTEQVSIQQLNHQKGYLSVVVGGMKSSITHYAHLHHIPFAWQQRFYDHIVRNQNEINLISDYIDGNIQNWGSEKGDLFFEPLP
jgi:REP element-mobilizing transposase RayT